MVAVVGLPHPNSLGIVVSLLPPMPFGFSGYGCLTAWLVAFMSGFSDLLGHYDISDSGVCGRKPLQHHLETTHFFDGYRVLLCGYHVLLHGEASGGDPP